MGITINDDAWCVALSVSVGGVTRETEVTSTTSDGEAVETERKVNERVANVAQHKKACELRNKLRVAVTRHTQHAEPLGNLCDSKRVTAFQADVAATAVLIEAHNAEPGQEHPVEFSVIALPIGRVFDESTQEKLVSIVTGNMATLRDLTTKGNIDGLSKFLAQRKNLSALMPSIIGRVIDSALVEARQNLHILREIRDERLPSTVPLSYEQLDAADGWLATQAKVEEPTP